MNQLTTFKIIENIFVHYVCIQLTMYCKSPNTFCLYNQYPHYKYKLYDAVILKIQTFQSKQELYSKVNNFPCFLNTYNSILNI